MSLSERPREGRPSAYAIASEPLRASLEVAALPWQLPRALRALPRGDGHPVLTLPGYGGADGSMAVMRAALKRQGYRSHALELGRNLDRGEDRIQSVDDALRFRRKMVGLIQRRLEQLYERYQQPVSLVGWSLGGVYAIDVAQSMPDKVRQVVTLGSPFGDPRGTTLFNVMRRISGSQVPLEGQDYAGWCAGAEWRTPTVPVTVIYSERDGIVSTSIARLQNDKAIRYRKVSASHIGFSHNTRAIALVAEVLATGCSVQ